MSTEIDKEIIKEKRDPIFFLVWTLVLVSILSNILVVGFIGTRFFTIKKNAADFTKLSTAMEGFIQDLQINLSDEKNILLPMLDQKKVTKIEESRGQIIEKGIELDGSTEIEKKILGIYEDIKSKTDDIKLIRSSVIDWRLKYNIILKDILEEKTLKNVLRQYGILNSSIKILEGKARLKQARFLKKLKKTDIMSEEAQVKEDLIKSVKNPMGTKLRRINKELTQIELNIEKLSSEDQVDHLVDLKDNKIRQGIDRLGKDISYLEKQGMDLNDLTSSNLKMLTSTIFGEGYVIDYEHQFIKVGVGGLYSLQKNRLLLLQTREELLNDFDLIFAQINALVAKIRQSAKVYLNELTQEQNRDFTSMWKNSLMLSGLFFIIFLILAWYILRNIKQQIQQKNDAEIGLKTERELALQLKDEALASADKLEKNAEEITQSNLKLEEQTKIKTDITELNSQMRGELEPVQLGNNILNFLVPFLNSQIGSFYIVTEENLLKLVSTYAHSDRKNLANELKFGESLIGQAAMERKNIVINNIPQDYIKISSGLGEEVPGSIFVSPIFFEDEVQGVLELGSFRPLTYSQTSFIDQINGDIGIVLHGSMARVKMKNLLEQTQQLSETLQSQQEELKTSNEDLENQTKALKKTEFDLIEKNTEIEISRKIVEDKAEELRISSKYKSEFLANMSHELRTPLNSTLILAKLLSQNKDGNLTQKQIEYAKTIHQSGTDLLELINEVLDLSKVEAGKLIMNVEEVNLKGFATFVQRNFKHMAQDKGLYLKIELDQNIPESIFTDRQRLEQIIKNFISNALKFTEKGGITLSMHCQVAESDLMINHLDPKETLAISIIDTGIGIPKEKQNTVFGAFQQADGGTSRKYGGTGLGLTISKELATKLGGVLKLKSTPGEGSTFSIYLPFKLEGDKIENVKGEATESGGEVDPEDHLAKPKIATVDDLTDLDDVRDDRRDISSSDKSILIIEDNPPFAKILQSLAQEKGFKTLVTGNGKTALHFADHHNPSAIILDLKLPDMDGRVILSRLKDNPRTRHIPVHVMSGAEGGKETLKMGAIGFLSKPIAIEQLEEAFDKMENIFSTDIKRLLVVGDNEIERKCIVELIGEGDIETKLVGKGQEALTLIQSEKFDCMILDLKLPDMTGFELLEKLKKDKKITTCPPVIVYTGKDISKKEEEQLRKYTDSIIIKSAQSSERLLDETTLFLHRVEEDLPKEKQERIAQVHDKEEIFQNKKILVVDDDMRNIFALTSILEDKGMIILAAKNGKESLEQLDKQNHIDLVLMDIMMPEMNGYEAMTIIRKKPKFQELPIIALTAKAMKGDRDKCIQSGASDYLAKPVDANKLLSLMRVWLYK